MAANLDALCDMLDAEISDEEEAEKEEKEDKGSADREDDSQIDDDVIAELDEVCSTVINGYYDIWGMAKKLQYQNI